LFTNPDGTGLIDVRATSGSANDHSVEFFVGGILTPDTTYYFKVTHTDPNGARPDTTNEPPPFPPVFTGVQAISNVLVQPGSDSALISWDANVIGLGQVEYNAEPDPGTIGPPPVVTVGDTLNITDHANEPQPPGKSAYWFRCNKRERQLHDSPIGPSGSPAWARGEGVRR
jgi:hypothetical protein